MFLPQKKKKVESGYTQFQSNFFLKNSDLAPFFVAFIIAVCYRPLSDDVTGKQMSRKTCKCARAKI